MLRTIATSPSFIYEVLILEVNNDKQGCLQHPHAARPASDAPDTCTLALGAALSELSREARYCATSMNNRSIQAKKIISPCLTIKKEKNSCNMHCYSNGKKLLTPFLPALMVPGYPWGAASGVPASTVCGGHTVTGEAGQLRASQHPSNDCRKLLMFSCIAGSLPVGNNALYCREPRFPAKSRRGASPRLCPLLPTPHHWHRAGGKRDFTLSTEEEKKAARPLFSKAVLLRKNSEVV